MAGAQGRAECGRRRCTSKPGRTKRERVRRILPNVPDRKGCGPHVALRETFRSPVRDGTAALRRPRRCNREASHRTGVSPCPTARDAIGCHAAAGRTATRRRSRSRSASDGTSIATSSATGRSISRRSSPLQPVARRTAAVPRRRRQAPYGQVQAARTPTCSGWSRASSARRCWSSAGVTPSRPVGDGNARALH